MDEDELIQVRRGDLAALFDAAVSSQDFGYGWIDNAEVELLRKMAAVLGVDPMVATPTNFKCQYSGGHDWKDRVDPQDPDDGIDEWNWECSKCKQLKEKPTPPGKFHMGRIGPDRYGPDKP